MFGFSENEIIVSKKYERERARNFMEILARGHENIVIIKFNKRTPTP
jgi:hypothetical protein